MHLQVEAKEGLRNIKKEASTVTCINSNEQSALSSVVSLTEENFSTLIVLAQLNGFDWRHTLDNVCNVWTNEIHELSALIEEGIVSETYLS